MDFVKEFVDLVKTFLEELFKRFTDLDGDFQSFEMTG